MNRRIFDTAGDAVAALARTILQRVAKQKGIAIGVSGGSTPQPLYEMLATPPQSDVLAAAAITWVLVDERYVPAGDPQSNARMIRSTLFRNGLPAGHRFLDFDTSLDDPGKTAARFEEQWQSLGIDRLDIVTLGVGGDGHTASLFPGTPVLDEEGVAAAVYVPRLEQWRVTLTMPVIQAANLRIVLAVGESKAAVIRDVAAGVDHPVTRAMSGEGEAWWFVDRKASPE